MRKGHNGEKIGLHSDGRTTKGRTTYNRTTNHRTISAMVCTTFNHVCGSLTLICDGMTGNPSIFFVIFEIIWLSGKNLCNHTSVTSNCLKRKQQPNLIFAI